MYKQIKQALPIFLIALSVIITIMILFPALKSDENETTIKGVKAVFGGEILSFGDILNSDIRFNILSYLAYFLPLVFSLCLFIAFNTNNKNILKRLLPSILLLASFILSLIVFSSLGSYTNVTITTFFGTFESTYEDFALGFGGLIALIASILGVTLSLIETLLILLKK